MRAPHFLRQVPGAELRSDAAFVIAEDVALDAATMDAAGVRKDTIRGGEYICATLHGVSRALCRCDS